MAGGPGVLGVPISLLVLLAVAAGPAARPAGACEDGSLHRAGLEHVELTAADGVTIFAHLFRSQRAEPAAVVLLFHQARSNASEYDPIAPRLVSLGYECLAIDQRSGGEMWGRANRTVAALGESTGYLQAYPDLEAALGWARKTHPAAKVVLLGSSYSASLVLKLAAEQAGVAAVAAFSPGEYMGPGGIVAGWARGVTVPVFVTSAGGRELAAVRPIFDALGSERKVDHVPATSVHGASALRPDRNAAGAGQMWAALEEFLAKYAPAGE